MSVHISIEDAKDLLDLFAQIKQRAPKCYRERNLALKEVRLQEEIRLEGYREKRRQRAKGEQE